MRKIIKNKKCQIAIEFILLASFAFFALLIFLVIINSVLNSKLEEKKFSDFEDFGQSVQNEFIFASEMEEGYHRILNIPKTINGKLYTLNFGTSTSGNGYFTLTSDNLELFYQIPEVTGNLTTGYNTIIKEENTVTILQGKH
ncbi:MAG: hypothetical protein ACP5N2_05055 [Candidatus Nanoarchaeia archaeon]